MMKTHNIKLSLMSWLFPALLAIVAMATPTMAGEHRLTAQQAYNQGIQNMPAAPIALREKVMVTGRLVNLGDFFEGAGDKAATPVAYAPQPGKRAVFDTTWLYRVARGYGLAWKPLSDKQQAVVRRESIAIGRLEIEDTVLGALVEQGTDPEMTVELSNRMLKIHVPSDTEATVAVEDLLFDQRTGRFTAWLIAPANGPISSRTRITGQVVKMLDVPVLKSRVGKDQIIRPDDIKWIEVRAKRIQNDIVTDVDELIGMTSRRGLRPDTPIQISDIQRPLLVKKGGLVTMVLKTPAMILTSQGRALDNGSDGDLIRITNTQSNKTVQAVVTRTGQVRVTSISSLAMN
ncbi:MAG: flagellar basal body P-ring formation chaperone FlgA [Alphaproteobacteria bacterium]